MEVRMIYNPGFGFRAGSNFGWRSDPFKGTPQFHAGMDYPAASGTPVGAAANGVVWYSRYNNSYGNTVIIKSIDVNGQGVFTLYAHLLDGTNVSRGLQVTAGQQIGEVGSTGARTTGSHLHFEIIREESGRIPNNADGGSLGITTSKDADLRENPRTYDFGASGQNSTPDQTHAQVPFPPDRPYDLGIPEELRGALPFTDDRANLHPLNDGNFLFEKTLSDGNRYSLTLDKDGYVLESDTFSRNNKILQKTIFSEKNTVQSLYDNNGILASKQKDLNADGHLDRTEQYRADGTIEIISGSDTLGSTFSAAFNGLGKIASYVFSGADGKQVYLNGDAIGGVLGSSIGKAIGGGNFVKSVVASTLVGSLGQAVGGLISSGVYNPATGEQTGQVSILANLASGKNTLDEAFGQAVSSFGKAVPINLLNNVTGGVSSLLVGELANAIGLNGFAAGAFTTVGTTITTLKPANDNGWLSARKCG